MVSCVLLEESRVCVFVFDRCRDEFKGVRQEQFMRAAAVGAQITHCGVVGVAQLKDLRA